MSTLAPFSSYMKLGQGFNSYTQEVCIENAVLISPQVVPSPILPKPIPLQPIRGNLPNGKSNGTSNGTTNGMSNGENMKPLTAAVTDLPHTSEAGALSSVSEKLPPPDKNMSQIVTYSSRSVSNMADIVDALNISASASIKYGTVKGSGSASYVNENKVNQSDLNYIITVKVTNSMTIYPDEMTFNPLDGMNPKDFTEIFGDCFISGFLEGGEFSAIISIKVDDKSKLHEVKAAAEAELAIAAVPGLSVGASAGVDKKKSEVWDETETTISVNWSGGGEIKGPNAKWDLPTVVDVACRFPHLVESSSQKTSAILTKYTSLRGFVAENAKLIAKGGKDAGFLIKDYSLCQLYSMDLFSAYMTYKQIWDKLSEMLKHTDRFREIEKSKDVPDPVQLTPKGLNEARKLARKQMTKITRESAKLVIEPERTEVDSDNEASPYIYPNELLIRLPIQETSLAIREQVDPSRGNAVITAEEIQVVGAIAERADHFLNPLSGDAISPSKALFNNNRKSSIICTIDTTQDPKGLDTLLKLRIHAHEHKHGEILADMFEHSKACEGYLCAIGYSGTNDSNSRPQLDGTHYHVGRPNENNEYWSHLADLSFAAVTSVVVEYVAGTEKIASLVLLDAKRNEVANWRQYSFRKTGRPVELKVDEQKPPNGTDWQLAGFWGHCDALVITRIGAIWKRIDSGTGSMAPAFAGMKLNEAQNGNAAVVH